MAAVSLRNSFLACGLLYSVLYPAVNDGLAANLYAGYNRMDQAVSELSAVGAPTHRLLTILGPLFSVLLLAFGLGDVASGQHNRPLRWTGILIVAHALMTFLWIFGPMSRREVIAAGGGTPEESLHLALSAATGLFITAYVITAAFAFGWAFRLYSVLTVAMALVFGIMSAQVDKIATGKPTPYMGLFERIGIGAWLLWLAVMSICLIRLGSPASG